MIVISVPAMAQVKPYKDGRPTASLRMNFKDEGIVMHYGNGKDSCDTYGAREAVVNKDGNTYYLFYDGAGKDGWIACLAESNDLKTWKKKGTILTLGDSTKADFKSASSPWVIKQGDTWHMFYVATRNSTPAPYRVPVFPYLTLKAQSASLKGPWKKQYDVIPLSLKANSYYAATVSPGFIVKDKNEYLMFFSCGTADSNGPGRSLGLARTNDLNKPWKINEKPLFPLNEQIENSSVYYDKTIKTWFLFTNHVGIDNEGYEYTDAIWVYWSKDLNKWDNKNKAIALDNTNSTWAKGAIGMPTVIKSGNRLALLYDAAVGTSRDHMFRNIGLAWIGLPLKIPE